MTTVRGPPTHEPVIILSPKFAKSKCAPILKLSIFQIRWQIYDSVKGGTNEAEFEGSEDGATVRSQTLRRCMAPAGTTALIGIALIVRWNGSVPERHRTGRPTGLLTRLEKSLHADHLQDPDENLQLVYHQRHPPHIPSNTYTIFHRQPAIYSNFISLNAIMSLQNKGKTDLTMKETTAFPTTA